MSFIHSRVGMTQSPRQKYAHDGQRQHLLHAFVMGQIGLDHLLKSPAMDPKSCLIL